MGAESSRPHAGWLVGSAALGALASYHVFARQSLSQSNELPRKEAEAKSSIDLALTPSGFSDAVESVPKTRRLATATRFWTSRRADLERLHRFIREAFEYSDMVIIAVNAEGDRVDTMGYLRELRAKGGAYSKLHAFSVAPWNCVTPALNALVFQAQLRGATELLFQSPEVHAKPKHVRLLQDYLDGKRKASTNDSLPMFVGARFPNAHQFFPNTSQPIDGTTIPWNTFGLWHLPTLGLTSFLSVSEGMLDGLRDFKMIEEVAAVALLQHLGTRAESAAAQRQAVHLVQMDEDFQWVQSFQEKPPTNDEERKQMEEKMKQFAKKVASKKARAEPQLAALGIKAGMVEHIVPQ